MVKNGYGWLQIGYKWLFFGGNWLFFGCPLGAHYSDVTKKVAPQKI